MGHAIASRRLHELGSLGVTDLRQDSAAGLIRSGAKWIDTAAATAANSDVVVLSLNTAPIVEQGVFGDAGLLEGWPTGADDRAGLIVDMSSIARERTVEFASRCAEKGLSWVDAPIVRWRSGCPWRAGLV